jgi:protease YdgD
MIMKRHILLIFCLFISHCKTNSASKPRNVFSEDNRVAWDTVYQPGVFPYHSVGMLEQPSGGQCTAAIISPQLALTAAHCVFKEGKNIEALRFKPYGKGWVDVEYLASGNTGAPGGNDWAVVKLSKPIEEKPFAIYDGAESLANRQVSLAGYSFDIEGLTVDQNCQIQRDTFEHLVYDCDMHSGASGGPVYLTEGDKLTIVGVNSSESLCKNPDAEGYMDCPDGTEFKPDVYNKGARIGGDTAKRIKQLIGEYQ